MIEVKELRAIDIEHVLCVQNQCYRPELIESAESFLTKIAICSSTCVGAWEKEALCGYLFAHPWKIGLPVQLDRRSNQMPEGVDGIYLHDLAVTPECRGRGVPRALLRPVLEYARCTGLLRFALVSVQGSEPFWERWGFSLKYTLPYAPGVTGSYMTCEGLPSWR